MSLVGFQARNHRQQVGRRGANPKVDDRATPPEVFGPLHDRFRFSIDACALPHNAKLPRYFTPEDDGLAQSWAGERVWCNPPYSSIEPWVEKAMREVADVLEPAELVVLLLPANRTEQGWWQRHIEPRRDRSIKCGFCGAEQQPVPPVRVEFLSGRLRFIAHDADGIKPNERPPFGCCLVIVGAVANASSETEGPRGD